VHQVGDQTKVRYTVIYILYIIECLPTFGPPGIFQKHKITVVVECTTNT